MSDGFTEAMKGSRFGMGEEVRIDDSCRDEFDEIKFEIFKQSDAQMKKVVSFTKSAIRVIGYVCIPFNLTLACVILVVSEGVGVIEELV